MTPTHICVKSRLQRVFEVISLILQTLAILLFLGQSPNHAQTGRGHASFRPISDEEAVLFAVVTGASYDSPLFLLLALHTNGT